MAGTSIRLDAKRSGPGFGLETENCCPFFPLAETGDALSAWTKRAGFEWVGEALTRTQEALETLWEAEELHRLLFVKVPQPRFVCDARTLRILAVNEATIRQYKYSRHEFHRMRVTDLGAPESLADFKKYCQELSSREAAPSTGRTASFAITEGRSLIDVEIDAP